MRHKSSDRKAAPKVFGPAPAVARSRKKAETGVGWFYGLFAGLLGTNTLTLVGFLMAPDIANLMNGQNDVVFAAYEDRIAQLRIEVDRLHSRQYAQAGDLNLQLQELTQQQEILIEQHHYVKQLAAKAAELGIRTADLPVETESPSRLVTSFSQGPAGAAADVRAASDALDEMMWDNRLALAAISDEAEAATDQILDALGGVGIRPKLPASEAMGGPFVPAREEIEDAGIVEDANSVMESLLRLQAARASASAAPIHRPVAAKVRTSSGYGNRKDPFSGRKAFHAGIDFPAPTGTTVVAAGSGKVTFAARRSGYGNVVEIAHDNGLMTRYAHLSAFLVKAGQSVATGTPIAKVGSTGRSTGPHLHFEVRREGEPLDPGRYLAAGKRVTQFM